MSVSVKCKWEMSDDIIAAHKSERYLRIVVSEGVAKQGISFNIELGTVAYFDVQISDL